MESRIFGKISFPNSNLKPIKNVWLNISESSIFVEIPWSESRNDVWGTVLGEFIGMEKVTLIGARISGGSSSGENSYRRMYVASMVVGTHINEYTDLLFNGITLESPALLDWAMESHFVDIVDPGPMRKYTIPEVLTLVKEKVDNTEVSIELAHQTYHSINELSITHKCYITLKFKHKIHLDEIRKRIYLMKKFVLFHTNAEPNFDTQILSIGNQKFEYVTPIPKLGESNFSQNLPCNYHYVKGKFPGLINAWFKKEKLQPVIDLLLEKYFNTSLSTPRHFQNMCVALESFHENFIEKKPVLQDSKILENKTSILNALDDQKELKEWFEKMSKFWEKPQLIDRLHYFKEAIQFISNYGIDPDIDNLLNRIKGARNEITHQGIHNKKFKQTELLLVSKILEFALKIEVLKCLGIDGVLGRDYTLLIDAKNSVRTLAYINRYNIDRNKQKK